MTKKDREKSFIMLQRVPQGFVPLSAFDYERCEKFPMFQPLKGDLTMPRSLPRHRLYWVILGIVADNQEKWPTAEDLHTAIKVKLGYIEDFVLIDGSLLIRPRSTDFDNMDEIEFRQYMDSAFTIISTDIIPGLDVKALVDEGKRKLGISAKERNKGPLPMLEFYQ